jgi:GMP synthase-like glutamine amidotransferase/ribosomal protein S18 acetylase RimI-like enzyme
MRIHFIEHVPFEGPGYIAEWATARGHEVTRSIAFTEEYPPLSHIDALVIMGGPMDADDEVASPWLTAEKRYVAAAIADGKLVVGVCLGSQILAEISGGVVTRNSQREIGWYPIHHTEATAADPVFSAFPDGMVVGHWHGDTFDLPPGAESLLSTDVTPNQAFTLKGGRVIAMQFHLEWSPEMVAELVDVCAADFASAGPFVQDPELMRAHAERYAGATREALFALLDRATRRGPEWRFLVVDGTDPALVEQARSLFAEYHEWLGTVVCSRSLGAETAALPGVYAPPAGWLLVARDAEGAAVGIVGVRSFDASGAVAEVKRLYVTPAARGAGLGRVLAERAIEQARVLGYREARLTTLPDSMGVALAMYRSLGFTETEPFYDHSHVDPDTDMVFMSREL